MGLSSFARDAVLSAMRGLERGHLTFVEDGSEEHFGDPTGVPKATIRVHEPRFYGLVLRRGSLGAAEAYLRGLWDCDDLPGVVRILLRNQQALGQLDRGPALLSRPVLALRHALRRNTRPGSRRNIAAHYDLGNAFFQTFLDPTMTYSCGIFEREDATLEDASRAKYERVCRKLELGPEHHVLEIGGGWGSFAVHAAWRHGCRVTTTTVSQAQFELARQRVEEAGLADRVDVLLRDYRDVEGDYDRLVSIEMIEAVGHQYFDTFFGSCSERLRPQGRMLLQAIVVPEQRYERSKRAVDFIKRYIFPGGCLPSVGAIAGSLARVTDLRIAHLEELSAHYARTLACWRENLRRNEDRARALGCSEEFLRTWEFYFGYCEGGFAERYNGVVQMVLAKPGDRGPGAGACA